MWAQDWRACRTPEAVEAGAEHHLLRTSPRAEAADRAVSLTRLSRVRRLLIPTQSGPQELREPPGLRALRVARVAPESSK